MTSLLGNVASILGMFGVIAFFVLLSVLVFKLIMFKENPNKRSEFMDGIVNLIAGIIIIGLMTVIVEMIYYYIQQIDPNMNSLMQQANTSAIKAGLDSAKQANDGSLLAGMIADLIAVLLKGLSALFGLKSIGALLMPSNTQIFTAQGWSMIMGGYVILIVPAVVLMLFMVFRTGLQFMMGGINPRDMTKARSSMLRWVIVLFLIIFGEIIIRGICIIGSDFTQYFNSQIQILMPSLSSQTSMFFGSDLGGKGIVGGIISLYMVYIQFRFNILFIVRDIMIVAFTIFTPIAVTFWGIEPSTVSLKVWFGEIVSNALMAFCLSIGLFAFAITYDIFAIEKTGGARLMLITLVGLTMILKIGSTLRNSTQGILFQFASLNEDKASKNIAGGGLAAGLIGNAVGRGLSKTGGKVITEGASKGAAAIKEKLETSGYNAGNSKGEGSKMNKVGEKADNSANAIIQDAIDNGVELNPKDLTSKGKNGNVNPVSNEAIGLNFADKMAENMKSGDFNNRKEATEAAKDATISDIANQYATNPELNKTMPPSITREDDINAWAQKKAENKFAEAVGSRSTKPVNHATVDTQDNGDMYEYFDPATANNDALKNRIEQDQQYHMNDNNNARNAMNQAVESVGTGRFEGFDNNMADTIADTARTDRKQGIVETNSDFSPSSSEQGTSIGAESYNSTSDSSFESSSSTSGSDFGGSSSTSSSDFGSSSSTSSSSFEGSSSDLTSNSSSTSSSNFGSSSSSSTGSSNFGSSTGSSSFENSSSNLTNNSSSTSGSSFGNNSTTKNNAKVKPNVKAQNNSNKDMQTPKKTSKPDIDNY